MRISDWSSDVCSSDLAHPGWVEATASVAVALSDVVRDVPVSARLLSAGGQAHAGRHHAGLDVAPQRDQQLAGERHEHDRADAPFGTARADRKSTRLNSSH